MQQNTPQKTNRKPFIIAVIALLALVVIFAAIWLLNREQPANGLKNITVEVIFLEGDPNEHQIATGQEYLAGALLDEGIIEGYEGEFGLFITSVDGVTADETQQQWWMLTKDGEMTDTGAGEVVLSDGDHYELTLSTW